MQAIPVIILALASILNAIAGVLAVIGNINDYFIPDILSKGIDIGSTLLGISATILSAIFLILGKYSNKALGFGVTLLGATMSAAFLAWTIIWFQ